MTPWSWFYLALVLLALAIGLLAAGGAAKAAMTSLSAYYSDDSYSVYIALGVIFLILGKLRPACFIMLNITLRAESL